MTPEELADLVHLRRARDLMDRDYEQPLDVPAMARASLMSPAHFSRKVRAAYGETPSQYRARDHRDLEVVPPCVSMVATRPRRTTVTV
ncbi:MAG: AraC family transcriptional regulator [Actinomycetes bacterium]